MAATHRTMPSRSFGHWLHEKYVSEGQPWPDENGDSDDRFAPICAAMTL